MSVVLLRYVQGIVKVLESGGAAIKKIARVQVNWRHIRPSKETAEQLFHSEKKFRLKKVLIPVGSRKYAYCRKQ